MEKVNVIVQSDKEGQVVFLTGQAPKSVNPAKIEILGSIDAPVEFVRKAAGVGLDVTQGAACLIVNRPGSLECTYSWNMHLDGLRSDAIGRMSISEALKVFGINTEKTYGPRELATFLKKNRLAFNSFEENASVVSSLNELKLKVEKELERSEDQRGNKKHLIESKVSTSMASGFVLNMPLFTGSNEKVSFHVEVCFEVRDAGVSCWLESVELIELVQRKIDEKQAELAEFFSGVAVIYW